MNVKFALIEGLLTGGTSTLDRGISGESEAIHAACYSAFIHYHTPVSRELVSARFAGLASTWREETAVTSSFTDMVLNSAYQQIIALGPDVVPIILRALERRPDHWFWALSALTGANPIPAEAAGDLPRMTDAWLQWGRAQGILR
jgi:hypothetical protein